MLSDADIPAGAFLAMIEDQGLTGSWHWHFASGGHAWSPGLFRLLGLRAEEVRPSYEALLACLHPEDRPLLESAAEVRTGSLNTHVVRIVRPDGSVRTVSSRGRVSVDPQGRPRAAGGLLLDVTDRERLVQAERAEHRRRRALFEQTQSWTNAALYVQGRRTGSEELLSLTGLSQEAYQADCARVVAAEDRARMTEQIRGLMAAARPFEIDKRLILADGGAGHFRFVYAPIRDACGTIESWATLASRVGGVRAAPVDPRVLRALEEGIGGAHLRAARALLDWSMADLAGASGLSFSTIRRLEEDDPGARAQPPGGRGGPAAGGDRLPGDGGQRRRGGPAGRPEPDRRGDVLTRKRIGARLAPRPDRPRRSRAGRDQCPVETGFITPLRAWWAFSIGRRARMASAAAVRSMMATV